MILISFGRRMYFYSKTQLTKRMKIQSYYSLVIILKLLSKSRSVVSKEFRKAGMAKGLMWKFEGDVGQREVDAFE